MTWMRKSTATMVQRDMRLKKLQLVIDEQTPMRIKPDSLIFLVKRKLQEYYVLLNHQQTLRGWLTTRDTRSIQRLVPDLCCESWSKFSAQTSCDGQDGGYSAEISDYMFIRTVAESKTQPCIRFVETRSGVTISFMCAGKGGYEDLTKEILRHYEANGFLNPVIIQCDKETSIIDVCRKVARERNARTVLRFAPKTSHHSNGFVEAVHGHIPDTNRDEHCHTAFSNFTCHSICDSSRWICALKIHSATRRQNPIPIFARNSICITFVHVW